MLVLILKLKVYLIANEQITEPDISGENKYRFEIYSDIGEGISEDGSYFKLVLLKVKHRNLITFIREQY